MLRVFIGYDSREVVAYHVAAHSIMTFTRQPVAITPVCKDHLPFWRRMRDKNQSTDFAYTRFAVPYLCDYKGLALFIDCDMLVRADICRLFDLADDRFAVQVVKHDYQPAHGTKFLGQTQTRYPCKNWSSVMLFNNAKCRALTPDYINAASGMELHQFKWCAASEVGGLPREWNCLLGEEKQCESREAKILHYTNGTPCFAAYSSGEEANWWYAMKRRMLDYDKTEHRAKVSPE